MTNKRPWNGGVGVGAPTYTPAEERNVLAAMREHVGIARATSEEALVRLSGVQGRPLRAILAAHDGVDFVLANSGDKRLYICEFFEQAEHTTRTHRSRARKLSERADRRDVLAANLPRLQGGFDFYGQPDDDDVDEPL